MQLKDMISLSATLIIPTLSSAGKFDENDNESNVNDSVLEDLEGKL